MGSRVLRLSVFTEISTIVTLVITSKLILGGVYAVAPADSSNEDESLAVRVVGGNFVPPTKHPSLAVLLHDDMYICGGSVVSSEHILTAAHCIIDPYNLGLYTVQLGVHDRVRQNEGYAKSYSVKSVAIHEQFHIFPNHMMINDVALLKVDNIEFNDRIKPICLPLQMNVSRFAAAVVEGWGLTASKGELSRFPKRSVLSILTKDQCQQSPLYAALKTIKYIDSMLVCAYRKNSDACQGDSGGPLIVKTANNTQVQIGIVSFGVGCGNSDFNPGLYTRVHHYRGWLLQHINASCLL